jgi:hypothetical protein
LIEYVQRKAVAAGGKEEYALQQAVAAGRKEALPMSM